LSLEPEVCPYTFIFNGNTDVVLECNTCISDLLCNLL